MTIIRDNPPIVGANAATSAGRITGAKDGANGAQGAANNKTILPPKNGEEELQTLEFGETNKSSKTADASATGAVEQVKQESERAKAEYQQQIEECMMQIEQCHMQIANVNSQKRSLLSDMTNPDVDTTKIMTGFSQLNQQKTKLYSNIQQILLNIENIETAIKDNTSKTADAIKQLENLQTQYASLSSGAYDPNGSVANITALDTNSDVGNLAAQMGKSFIGTINSDAAGNAEFSPGGTSQAWCADFATSITKRAYQAKGIPIPSGFGSSSVSGLKDWGIKNGRYTNTVSMPAAQKAQWIAQNLKPGDLMIEKEGMSHTGIVTKVNPDGSFETIEGNSSNAVKARSYPASSAHLTGFVKMS